MKKNLVKYIIRNQQDQSITMYNDNPQYTLLWLHGLGGQASEY